MEIAMFLLPAIIFLGGIASLVWRVSMERKWKQAAENRAQKWEDIAGRWETAYQAQDGLISAQKLELVALEKKADAFKNLADERLKMISLLKSSAKVRM